MTTVIRNPIGRHAADTDPGADWRDRGECRDEDPELFFTNGSGAAATSQNNAAKAVCRRCPVERQCRTWALDSDLPYGVAGGMTADERRVARAWRTREATGG